MVKVQLPDGTVVEHPDGVRVVDVLRALNPRLADQAVAAKVDGQVVELSTRLTDGQVKLTALKIDDPEGLHVARHSAAHVMAEAICQLWPNTKLVYGPPVDNGFYYDIDLDYSLTPEDFERIEARMAEIVKEDRPFVRYEMPRDEAMRKLEAERNEYKIDNALRAEGDTLSFYSTGEPGKSFEDLCRGPHVPSTGRIGAFKVMQVAGAYHHGDATKQMLQRVYGTTWPNKKALQEYLRMMEEAKKRDHRKLGQELGLFTISPLVGTGLILWKPHGATIRHVLEEELRKELIARGYQLVYTPHIGRLDLYRTSGHFPYYRESQYPPLFESERARMLNRLWELAGEAGEQASPAEIELFNDLAAEHEDLRQAGYPKSAPREERQRRIRAWLAVEDGYLLKPMNCPHHIQIYTSEARSYRQLPVKLAEFGQVYRYEKSGEVNGMTRVRGFCQDDAHVFCTPQQLPDEIAECVDLSQFVLKMIGLNDYRVRIGLRDPDSKKYIGSEENWRMAQEALRRSVAAAALNSSEEVGEAAFYGPKIDFVVRDCIGREWQLGTVQVDYNLPERFGLTYIGEDNSEHRPVMVHRTLFGSMERFVGILIEHFAGKFPLWLAPVQVTVCSVSEKSAAYAAQVAAACRTAGLRTELDNSSERIGAKIRSATMMKVPYILVVGEQEMRNGAVNVRTREGQQYGSFRLSDFLAACATEIATHGEKTPAPGGQAPAVEGASLTHAEGG
ncbi:MAG TPA: threonine--tRNA ligase [Phycisphaerae bacterium]|nr:threonine--tRNA ligase [Phycisphaerae bacterium]